MHSKHIENSTSKLIYPSVWTFPQVSTTNWFVPRGTFSTNSFLCGSKKSPVNPMSSTSPPNITPERGQAFLGVYFTTNLGQELHVWRFGGKFFGETHLQRVSISWVFRGTNVGCKSPNGNIRYPIQSRRLVGWVVAVERLCLVTKRVECWYWW